MLIGEITRRNARRHPDKPAIVHEGTTLTWAALDERANRIAHWLTGTECVLDSSNAPWGGGRSVDQELAENLQAPTRFASVELGVQIKTHSVWDRMSYRAAYQPAPPEVDPAAALDRIFAGFDADPANAARLRARRLSILDAVTADFAHVNAHDAPRADRLCGHFHVERQTQIFGEVIERAEREHTERLIRAGEH